MPRAGAFRLVFESDLRNEPAVRERVDRGVPAVHAGGRRHDRRRHRAAAAEVELLAVGLTGTAEVAARYWLESGRARAARPSAVGCSRACPGAASRVFPLVGDEPTADGVRAGRHGAGVVGRRQLRIGRRCTDDRRHHGGGQDRRAATPRELVLESTQSPDEVEAAVRDALEDDGGVLALVDEKGRRVVVPATQLAYVEIAETDAASGRLRRQLSRRTPGGASAPAPDRRPAAGQPDRPSALHAARCGPSVSRANSAAEPARSAGGPPTTSSRPARPARRPPAGPGERLADQPAGPQRQPPGHRRVRLDRRPHPRDRELGVPGVGEHLQHQVAGRRVQERGHLAVEVGRDPVADVRLDQALQPVARRGAGVERRRRGRRTAPSPRRRPRRARPAGRAAARSGRSRRPPSRPARPAGQRRRQPGVLGQPVERGQLAVREHAEQVDDGLRVADGRGGVGVVSAASMEGHGQRNRLTSRIRGVRDVRRRHGHVRGLRTRCGPAAGSAGPQPAMRMAGRSPGRPASAPRERGDCPDHRRTTHDNIDAARRDRGVRTAGRPRSGTRTARCSPTSASTEPIVQALATSGITRTFAIQEMTLPIALAGTDLIGQARTGTGKTLGFGVPLLQRIVAAGRAARAAAPSRRRSSSCRPASCASRSPATCRPPARTLGVRVLAVYGGRAYEPQIERAAQGRRRGRRHPRPAARPGRAGPPRLGSVSRSWCSTRPTRCSTSASCPTSSGSSPGCRTSRQTMLFSATMPGPIVTLARRYMRQPVHIRAEEPDEDVAVVPQTAAVRLPGARDGQGRDARPDPAGRGPRADDGLLPDQAHRAEGRRRPGRARLRRRRGARRPRPGRPRAGAARVPLRQGRRAGRHRRRRPRASTSRASPT